MPQIAQIAETYSSQIFWLLLTFGFVFFVIGLGMVPKVQGTADARDAKISGDLDAAKAAFARADAVVQSSFWVPRLAPSPMECRTALELPVRTLGIHWSPSTTTLTR